jgi:hypothetical protein
VLNLSKEREMSDLSEFGGRLSGVLRMMVQMLTMLDDRMNLLEQGLSDLEKDYERDESYRREQRERSA